MNRTLSLATGLLAVAFAVSGCANLHFPGMGGSRTLIDGGQGLENWNRVGAANWHVADGAIVADRKEGKPAGFLMTKDSYRDFRLHVEFWASHDANSGIYMRCEDLGKVVDTTCYEANIFDERPDPSYGTGAIVHVSKIDPMPKAGGRWNTYDITLKGDHLVVVLNGTVTADVRDARHAAGPIGLQYAAGTIKFRRFEVEPL